MPQTVTITLHDSGVVETVSSGGVSTAQAVALMEMAKYLALRASLSGNVGRPAERGEPGIAPDTRARVPGFVPRVLG